MPDVTLKQAMREAYASAPTDRVIVHTIELRHPAFDEPIRVVQDYFPVTVMLEPDAPVNGGEAVEFQAFAFEFTLPEVIENGVPELQIRIDNVDAQILANIELAAPEVDNVEVTYRAYLSNTLLVGPQNDPPLHMTLTNISADSMSVTARASIADFINKKFPALEYDEVRFPGLIAD